MATDVVNLRDGPSLDADVLGAVRHDQLVHVTGSPTMADDLAWYPVAAMVASGRTGWMAGEQGSELFLEPVTGTVEQTWCGRLDAGTTLYGSPGVKLTAGVRFGGLEVPSALFDPGVQGALAVAWGADATICMDLTVSAAELASVTVPTFAAEVCGVGSWGAQAELALSVTDPELKPSGVDLGRGFWLHDAMLGFPTYDGSSADFPNLGKLLLLSSEAKSEACMKIQASGHLGSTSMDMTVSTRTCVAVVGRSGSEVGLAPWSPTYGQGFPRPYAIGPDSVVGPEFASGAVVDARLTATGGPAGELLAEAIESTDCELVVAP